MQGRVPAEVGDVEPQIKTGMEEIAALFLHLIWFVVNIDRRHSLSLQLNNLKWQISELKKSCPAPSL